MSAVNMTENAAEDGTVGPIESVYTSSFGFITPMVFGILSTIASLAIIYIISKSVKGFTSTYHRLITAMSISDIVRATAIALTTIPMPKEGADDMAYQFEGIRLGNAQTCTAQAYFVILGTGLVYGYTANLCIYYAASIYFCMSESRIARFVEPILHLVQFLLLTGSTTALIVSRKAGSPQPYQFSWCSLHSMIGIETIFMTFLFSFVIAVLIIIIISLALVLGKVIIQNRNLTQYLQRANLGSSEIVNRLHVRNRMTRVASVQSLAYILSFLITVIFQTINTFMVRLLGDDITGLGLSIIRHLHLIFQPSIGIFNFLVFVSSKILIIRYTSPDVSICGAFKRLFWYQQEVAQDEVIITGIYFSRAEIGGINPRLSEEFDSWDEFEARRLPFSSLNIDSGRINNVSRVSSGTSNSKHRVSSAGED